MDNLEDKLKKSLKSEIGFDVDKNETQRKEMLEMYDNLLRKLRWFTWAGLIVFAVITICAINVMVFAKSAKIIIICGVVILGVGQLEVLTKLWYWLMNTKINILKGATHLFWCEWDHDFPALEDRNNFMMYDLRRFKVLKVHNINERNTVLAIQTTERGDSTEEAAKA